MTQQDMAATPPPAGHGEGRRQFPERQPPTRPSRRTILRAGVGGAAALGLGAFWATRQPELTFASGSYGAAGPSVLVAYDSQYGSTGDVAVAIGQALSVAARVDVRRIDQVSDVTPYSAVVLGAPVQRSAWKTDAVDFARTHAAPLAGRPSAVFLTSMSFGIDPNRDAQEQEKRKILEAAVAAVPGWRPVSLQPFGGYLDYGRMAPAHAAMYRVMAGNDTAGDFRDFAAIAAWAQSLIPSMTPS